MNIYDVQLLNELLKPKEGIESLSQASSPLSFQYEDELYPQINNEDEEDYLYPGMEDMRYETPRTISDQNRILGQTFTQQQPNFFQRMFNRASDIYGSGRNLIGQGIGTLANLVTGNPLVGGVMSLMSRMKTPMSEYQMRDLQRRGYGDELSRIYGPGGIMQGYNPVSMFGRGPLESIINRRNKAKSEAAIQKLDKAITDLGGSTDRNLSAYRASRPASERRSTGFGKSGMGRDPDRFK